jgi:hypothetical protein
MTDMASSLGLNDAAIVANKFRRSMVSRFVCHKNMRKYLFLNHFLYIPWHLTRNTVVPAQAGTQVVLSCEASEIRSFGSVYNLDTSFASSRCAACLLTPLRWNDGFAFSRMKTRFIRRFCRYRYASCALQIACKTFPVIIDKLNVEANRILKNQALRERLGAEGADFIGGTVQSYGAFMHAQAVKWAKVVKFAQIKLD